MSESEFQPENREPSEAELRAMLEEREREKDLERAQTSRKFSYILLGGVVALAATIFFFPNKPMPVANAPEDKPARTRCAECLKVGLENWKTMVSTRVAQAHKEQAEGKAQSSRSWFGGRSAQNPAEEVKRWEAEEALLEDRIRRIFPVLVGESGLDTLSPNSSLFV